jgi:hypothetical protein
MNRGLLIAVIVLLILVLVFGGLAAFVARIFLIGLLVALLIGVIAGVAGARRIG